MKILWVSLVKFPPLCSYLGEEAPAHCGWMYSSAKAMLMEMPEVQLGENRGDAYRDVSSFF